MTARASVGAQRPSAASTENSRYDVFVCGLAGDAVLPSEPAAPAAAAAAAAAAGWADVALLLLLLLLSVGLAVKGAPEVAEVSQSWACSSSQGSRSP